ncbi:MAG: hypothetical protein IID45_08310 [Planctomycetes bacterium]|nr:hypothetical protein [Planctomycetota bacterium]
MLEVANSDIGGVATLVLILVLAFAIDRVVRAVLFVLSFIAPWARQPDDTRHVGHGQSPLRQHIRKPLDLKFRVAGLAGQKRLPHFVFKSPAQPLPDLTPDYFQGL